MSGMRAVAQTIFKVLGLTIALSISTAGGICSFALDETKTAVIAVEGLNLREAPDVHAPRLKLLKKGTVVTLLSPPAGKWLNVSSGDLTGYIANRKQYVTFTSPSPHADRSEELNQIERKAENTHRRIKTSEEKIRTLNRKQTNVLEKLDQLERDMNGIRKKTISISADIRELEMRTETFRNETNDLQDQIAKREAYFIRRLKSLYTLNRLGTISITASAQSLSEFLRLKTCIKSLMAYDEHLRRDLISDKAKMADLINRLNNEKTALVSLQEDYNRQIKRMTVERTRRNQLLTQIRTDTSLETTTLESLKQSALQLKRLLSSLQVKPVQKIVQKKTFSALRGLLNVPVKGKICNLFGSNKHSTLNIESFRSGIDIRADRGEPIIAVDSGRIIYSNWLKSYGNMVIIDHGDHYYSVYAHAEEVFKKPNALVDTGEVIATVGDTGSLDGPKLYFEIRHRGKPLNPLNWLRH